MYGRMPVFGVPGDPELPFRGVYLLPGGAAGKPVLVVEEDEFDQPNRRGGP